jgi:hypothetical protein
MYVLCSFRGRYFYYVPNVLAMDVGRTEASSVRHGWDGIDGEGAVGVTKPPHAPNPLRQRQTTPAFAALLLH